jgi:hypothetical protein
MVSVSTTAPGTAAVEALWRRLDELRGGSVLSPAVVVCTSPVMAVGMRRALGARPGGVAGVTFTTVGEFANRLARPALVAAGLRTARRAETVAAVRAALRAEPGRFGRVADHRTTEERLVAFGQELVGLPPEVMDGLAAQATGLSIDALRVVADADRLMADVASPDRLIHLALGQLDRLEPGALGPIVLFLPDPRRPFEGRLIQALARRRDCEVMVGLTGLSQADQRHLGRLAGWSIQVPSDAVGMGTARGTGSGTGTGDANAVPDAGRSMRLEVADPEEEVRAAVRDLTAHAAAGVPLTESAILYATAEPYAQLLIDHLEAAGIPWCGPGHRRLEVSLTGRTMRRLLGLATRGMEREAVMTLLGAAPIDDGQGREVPAATWDRLSRQAGVIDGEHWQPRLSELAKAADDEGSRETTVGLARFVERLADALRPPADKTWTAWSAWAVDLLDRYLLAPGRPGADESGGEPLRWPHDEMVAHERVRRLLADLGDLDHYGQPPTLDTFEASVAGELAGAVVPGRPFGTGVYIGSLDSVPGLAFERIAVVGLTEGVFPRTPREDSLLPDQLRAAGRGMLIEKSNVTDADVRAVALAAASSRRPALLVTARGDLRSNRSRSWPRVLNGLVESVASLDSHHQGLVDHGRPAGVDDFGLRALIAHVDADDPVQTHELASIDPVLAANLQRVGNRRRPELTRHVGLVPAGRFDPTEQLLSPTALETYAACPRKYLMGRVLRLGEDDRPERIDEITARDRGTLVHRILERFIADAIADDAVPEPDTPWPAERRAHLFDLLDIELKLASSKGITGGQVKTKLLRRALYRELLNFLDTDDGFRAEWRSTPHAAEYRFGFSDVPALHGLWGGRPMQLRGSIDRVDVTEDGGVLVIDYKGGSKSGFEGMADNPLNDGRRLQLPLYARAVAEHLQLSGRQVGLYWLTKVNELRPMELDDRLADDLDGTVGAALDGIGAGVFPGVPGEVVGWPRLSYENCKYCDFDRVCPTDRQSEWERIEQDPALTPIDRLLGRSPTEAAAPA